MSRTETAIFTNMCMVEDGKGNVLMQDRADKNWPGLVYPGGHVEPGESFVLSVIREVREETGITVLNPRLCGVKQFWTRDEGARYVVFFFKASEYEGELKSSSEGEVCWIPKNDLPNRNTVEGFDEMAKVFDNEDVTEVMYKNHIPTWY